LIEATLDVEQRNGKLPVDVKVVVARKFMPPCSAANHSLLVAVG
jgi:hypothetical protein